MTETEAVIESVVAAKFSEQQQRISDLESDLRSLQKNLAELRQMLEPKKGEILVGTDDSCDYSGGD